MEKISIFKKETEASIEWTMRKIQIANSVLVEVFLVAFSYFLLNTVNTAINFTTCEHCRICLVYSE